MWLQVHGLHRQGPVVLCARECHVQREVATVLLLSFAVLHGNQPGRMLRVGMTNTIISGQLSKQSATQLYQCNAHACCHGAAMHVDIVQVKALHTDELLSGTGSRFMHAEQTAR